MPGTQVNQEIREPLQFQLSLLRLAVMAHASVRTAAQEEEQELETLSCLVGVPRATR